MIEFAKPNRARIVRTIPTNILPFPRDRTEFFTNSKTLYPTLDIDSIKDVITSRAMIVTNTNKRADLIFSFILDVPFYIGVACICSYIN